MTENSVNPQLRDQSYLLNCAIHDASRERLQITIQKLSLAVPQVWDHLINEFLVTEDSARQEGDASTSDASDPENESDENADGKEEKAKPQPKQLAGSKRLRSRYAFCDQCEEEFDVTTNTSTACRYHPDMSYPDDEYFDDWDEDGPHGPIDRDDVRESYPEGFIYGCCDEDSLQEGCETGWHNESYSSKRPKGW
ncbi:hypothetical protein BDV40DRAFT_275283 [Aspergillus tamarii]|uniref:C2H2-type domain-containing protein n=1 Tax=Aspergillus tamarii TaxID=41984 RepID=A0A5N6UJ37_ASPTM|nr:hypothetical protein BDV40DRAFT_275283 [Aspergillus tamarii]